MTEITKMEAATILRKHLEEGGSDQLRDMVQMFAEALMGADADGLCGAAYGERSPDRVNQRNGYRTRRWDTRVGTIELGIPKLRAGSYFPEWLLEPRRRSERALIAVVAESYVKGGLDEEGRQGRQAARHRGHREVASQRARQEPGRAGERVSVAAARSPCVPVRVARRASSCLSRRCPTAVAVRSVSAEPTACACCGPVPWSTPAPAA